jgi:CMP/dCMP kinase
MTAPSDVCSSPRTTVVEVSPDQHHLRTGPSQSADNDRAGSSADAFSLPTLPPEIASSLPRAFIVTIDGQAATGKSTTARQLAEVLKADYLDTGAMYRAITYLAIKYGVDITNHDAVANLVNQYPITFDFSLSPPHVLADGEDLTEGRRLRSTQVDQFVAQVAAIELVRRKMREYQRTLAKSRGRVVTEGRDQGELFASDALIKFFLKASPEVRAERRWREVGGSVPLEIIEANLKHRDDMDVSRQANPMAELQDSEVIDTSLKSPSQIVTELCVRLGERVAASARTKSEPSA